MPQARRSAPDVPLAAAARAPCRSIAWWHARVHLQTAWWHARVHLQTAWWHARACWHWSTPAAAAVAAAGHPQGRMSPGRARSTARPLRALHAPPETTPAVAVAAVRAAGAAAAVAAATLVVAARPRGCARGRLLTAQLPGLGRHHRACRPGRVRRHRACRPGRSRRHRACRPGPPAAAPPALCSSLTHARGAPHHRPRPRLRGGKCGITRFRECGRLSSSRRMVVPMALGMVKWSMRAHRANECGTHAECGARELRRGHIRDGDVTCGFLEGAGVWQGCHERPTHLCIARNPATPHHLHCMAANSCAPCPGSGSKPFVPLLASIARAATIDHPPRSSNRLTALDEDCTPARLAQPRAPHGNVPAPCNTPPPTPLYAPCTSLRANQCPVPARLAWPSAPC
eukprot:350008-Chlamydomonas_euryale.AAC.4